MEKRAGFRWPKHWRLQKSQDFRLVYNLGRRRVFRCIVLVWVPGPEGKTRVGLAAARSLGTHVQRNRAKRRLREILRAHKECLPRGLDMVFIARPPLLEVPFEAARREVLEALAHFPEGKTG